MVEKLNSIADSLYAVHADLMALSIAGKDCQSFCNTLSRIGQLQQAIREAASQIAKQEKKDNSRVKGAE
jgi:hypothetical protein